MFVRIFLAAALLLTAACTTTNTRTAALVTTPPAGSRVLLVEPDIKLNLLTTVGLPEPRADWSDQARGNLNAALQAALTERQLSFRPIDPQEAMGGREGQLLRLHQAVGTTILTTNFGEVLPTRAGQFNYTLGQGAQVLGQTYEAGYALFLHGSGSYASGGRVAAAIGLAALGVSVPLGSQQVFVSLVDLNTGQVIWFNYAIAGPHADMRDPNGARILIDELLADAPL